ncbi:hypothetical protein NLG97_g3100 [Lecanicillium saksenae]|uniref:Uncharacterized protein n=1 Tax=Lecanicillium saksenae TaxID=468837 RepID=A0ACC1QZ11_9HYPO|nr:hypothetical protein NLG97_g3100 [Lecanicillium saksenae]
MKLKNLASPWCELNPGVWARECIGEEQTTSYCQNIRDGHSELTVDVPFTSNIESQEELIQRTKNAWLMCHSRMPECATEISTGTELPQILTYRMLQSDSEAASWLQESFRVVIGKTVDEVARYTYNRRLTTQGKRSMLFLVIDPTADAQRRHNLIYNVSHVVSDAFSIPALFNEVFRQMTLVPASCIIPVSAIDYSGVVERLPVHPSHLYEAKFQPTNAERGQAVADVLAQEQVVGTHISESIALYTEPNAEAREHETHCFNVYFSDVETQKLLSDLRRENISITFAATAATLLAVKKMYSRGHETGALVGMTRNARRWVETGQFCPSASSVVFLWIPFEEQWFEGSTKHAVLHLARAIKAKLLVHLQSPHYLSMLCVSSASLRAVNGMAEATVAEAEAQPCVPGFSSQGAVGLQRQFDFDGTSVTAHDIRHTGRQISDSPWVGMLSIFGRITLSLGFDSKYHCPEKMSKFLAYVQENLTSAGSLDAKL